MQRTKGYWDVKIEHVRLSRCIKAEKEKRMHPRKTSGIAFIECGVLRVWYTPVRSREVCKLWITLDRTTSYAAQKELFTLLAPEEPIFCNWTNKRIRLSRGIDCSGDTISSIWDLERRRAFLLIIIFIVSSLRVTLLYNFYQICCPEIRNNFKIMRTEDADENNQIENVE